MASTSQRVRCPTCKRELAWESAPFRPFCSERCRLIDLGAWLSEKHAIPGDSAEGSAQDASPAAGHGEDPRER